MRLDWMQRQEVHINTNKSDIQIYNIKINDTGKKIAQLKNEFKDLFDNYKAIKDLSVQINLKEGAQVIRTMGK